MYVGGKIGECFLNQDVVYVILTNYTERKKHLEAENLEVSRL